jgi:1,4-dihydroxy-6-naphthoate synthase
MEGIYEVSAISFHAFPKVASKYALLSSGSSMGDKYGPMVISKTAEEPSILKRKKIAIPGTWTTAFLALKLYEPEIDYVVMPFDKILPAVAQGEIDLGLIIHEGQLTYQESGLHKIIDLGEWWFEKTGGLPLPLGGNVIRRDLGGEDSLRVAQLLREAIQYSLDHREAALDYAATYARGLKRENMDRFVGMYVNDLTVDYGERGREAVRRLFAEAVQKRLISVIPPLEFIG